MALTHGESEALFARDRVSELLGEDAFDRIADGYDADDGWRGEFLGKADGEDVILITHKPSGSPYLTLGTLVDVEAPDEPDALLGLIDVVSDYDVSFYFRRDERPACHLTSRLFISSLNRDDLRFAMRNLLVCRDSVMEWAQADDASA